MANFRGLFGGGKSNQKKSEEFKSRGREEVRVALAQGEFPSNMNPFEIATALMFLPKASGAQAQDFRRRYIEMIINNEDEIVYRLEYFRDLAHASSPEGLRDPKVQAATQNFDRMIADLKQSNARVRGKLPRPQSLEWLMMRLVNLRQPPKSHAELVDRFMEGTRFYDKAFVDALPDELRKVAKETGEEPHLDPERYIEKSGPLKGIYNIMAGLCDAYRIVKRMQEEIEMNKNLSEIRKHVADASETRRLAKYLTHP